VRIDAQTQSAEEGMLFQTSGLEFTHVKSPSAPADGTIASATRLVLACATDAPLHEGVGSVGGERRLVHWQLTAGALPPCPQDIYKQIVTTGCCRLLLLTPACFAQGFLPQWLLTMTPGVTVEVVGAALGRFQGASGWDLQAGHAKAARKLAPAGAVYFLRLHGQSDAVAQFVRSTWMGCISDDAQSRRDGFGLAVVGNWNGQLQSMEVT
jgi:CRISPR-associated protein Cmr3